MTCEKTKIQKEATHTYAVKYGALYSYMIIYHI